MEVAQHNWKEVVPETVVEAEETVEEALIGRRARRTANDDGGAVNGDDLSSSDEEEANSNIGFENLDASINGNHETGNTKGEILSGVCLPPSGESLGHDSPDETGNIKGEILSGVCLPPLLGHDSQDEKRKGVFTSGVCHPPSLGHDSESSPSVRKGSENERIVEEVEEEVVELDFFDTTAVDKLHTHNAYCPNCSSRITKVVLRRVKRERRIVIEPDDRHDQTTDLLGCTACFSIFIRIGKKLNPFPIFGSGGGTNSTEIAREPHVSKKNSLPSGSATVGGKPVANEDGCFDLHWFFHKRREQDDEKKLTEPGKDLNQANSTADLDSSHGPFKPSDGQNGHPFPNGGLPSTKDDATDHKSPSPKKPVGTPPGKGPIHPGSIFDLGEKGGFIPGAMPAPSEIKENKGDDCRIPMEDPGASPSTVDSSSTRRPVLSVEVKDSKSLEIVKCIVYGGLIESITSLGVVSSAAASDADTLKIVTIGVANLIGGLFVIIQNLVDLKYNVGGGPNLSDYADRYRELLGQRKHFLLHATFALLSYFVFGLVPPVVYGFAFRKSDDRDYKLIAVAAASLMCVIILATAKAYTRGANKCSKYFKTIVSYVIVAGTASGVGYAAGHLFKRLMDDLGWFDTKPARSLFSPEMISQNPAWASY
ncbi:hypothetical protein K7X08_004475 [Anisodus acutangulus]|uniref:Membrane protein of ER body-like protein n=1 Tax=Anisodus acutangulus TaxID=402998 RepID=A0A9Q1MH85_9SOLA|nr:hypothetical protein K7X08_004475 [Anisodus acutangulus]